MSNCEQMYQPQPRLVEAALSWLQDGAERHIIPITANSYPESLLNIDDAPLLLFAQGNIDCIAQPSIAMVGARNASAAGRELAYSWANQLAGAGWGVTSGLALGIDGACHQGALDSGGSTIAVLGSGLSNIYPKRHQALAQRIIDQGVLLSEYWPAQGPLKHHFPQRNRIVSGLSYGLVVVEAGLKSGSLISARLAAEQGREVFAVPGSVHDNGRHGCHWLIQQGAKLVTDPVDIIEELAPQWRFQPSLLATQLPPSTLLDSVGYEVTPVDIVVQRSELPVEVVITQLIEMELDGLVVAVPGGYVRRKGG
ncbi:DNA-protecting protein DprA [Ferrimonas lipolytica]|uniref:DNA-protecting protein DprA n=2 Tax=Ferrimonas lipolytica TaxID=2724191 RepID=A0A6H1UJY7_9GAMM|nr:DNA-protecting protein DprA [Ferrimonas lipolytica]